MSGYVIMVDFRLKPRSRASFRKLVDANARQSVAEEPGCRRFDVLEPEGEADRIVLYEIYDDRPAFEAHMRTTHFLEFDAATRSMVEAKAVSVLALVCEGSAAR